MYKDYEVNKKNIVDKKMMLIEDDAGYISPSDVKNVPLITELRKVDNTSLDSNKLIVYVVLQKYGIKNKNNRIYPESVLKKQNELYQQAIRERRAIGECVPEGTEIMTNNGWVDISKVSIDDEVFTLNLNTNKIETQKVNNTIAKQYNDDLVHIYNDNTLDMKLTKNHKVILWDRNGKPYEMLAIDVYNALKQGDSKVSHSYIKYGGDWTGQNDEYFTIPNTNININIHDWAAFLGIFISEGHTSGSRGGKTKNKVIISQTKPKEKDLIIELLNKLPFKYTISNDRQFIIHDIDLYNHLKVLGNSWEKHIPIYAKNWTKEVLNTLLTWLLIGDGRNKLSPKGDLLREYCTASKKLSEDVFEIMLKLGSGATINTRKQLDRYITDIHFEDKEIYNEDGTISLIKEKIIKKRLIKSENSKLLYLVSEKNRKSVSLDSRFTKADLIPFNDMVYCVFVQNKTWLMRYNNKVAWTHNCDHPETSIISADRISHNIIETWWEGRTLMGKAEILITRGYSNFGIISSKGDLVADLLRNNIMIGVSSRGLGSLSESNGSLIVQDDFEIICWDIVTSPSTPGSWMSTNKDEIKQYVEGVQPKINVLNESLDKFLV